VLFLMRTTLHADAIISGTVSHDTVSHNGTLSGTGRHGACKRCLWNILEVWAAMVGGLPNVPLLAINFNHVPYTVQVVLIYLCISSHLFVLVCTNLY
jgi:hypothetical protein